MDPGHVRLQLEPPLVMLDRFRTAAREPHDVSQHDLYGYRERVELLRPARQSEGFLEVPFAHLIDRVPVEGRDIVRIDVERAGELGLCLRAPARMGQDAGVGRMRFRQLGREVDGTPRGLYRDGIYLFGSCLEVRDLDVVHVGDSRIGAAEMGVELDRLFEPSDREAKPLRRPAVPVESPFEVGVVGLAAGRLGLSFRRTARGRDQLHLERFGHRRRDLIL